MDYLGRHKIMLGVVGLLAAVSALAALLGTYMIRPIVNGVLENGSAAYLAGVVALTAGIYIVGALSTLGYTQLMVRAAQKILQDIRRDLFAHLQTLPLLSELNDRGIVASCEIDMCSALTMRAMSLASEQPTAVLSSISES